MKASFIRGLKCLWRGHRWREWYSDLRADEPGGHRTWHGINWTCDDCGRTAGQVHASDQGLTMPDDGDGFDEIDSGECPYCGGAGVLEDECECQAVEDICCCLHPRAPVCPECRGRR